MKLFTDSRKRRNPWVVQVSRSLPSDTWAGSDLDLELGDRLGGLQAFHGAMLEKPGGHTPGVGVGGFGVSSGRLKGCAHDVGGPATPLDLRFRAQWVRNSTMDLLVCTLKWLVLSRRKQRWRGCPVPMVRAWSGGRTGH